MPNKKEGKQPLKRLHEYPNYYDEEDVPLAELIHIPPFPQKKKVSGAPLRKKKEAKKA